MFELDIDDAVQRVLSKKLPWEEIEQRYKPTTLGELLLRTDFTNTVAIMTKALTDVDSIDHLGNSVMCVMSLKRESVYRKLKEEYGIG